jgi:RND superfamily putative drug exporter
LIIALWIVVLICAVPLALKAGEVLDYDTTNMAGPDAESINGAAMIEEYFYSSDVQMESAVLLVASFDTLQGKINALSMGNHIKAALPDYVDEYGDLKIRPNDFMTYGLFTAKGNENEGVVIYAAFYSDRMVEENLVVKDTPEFRNFVQDVLSSEELSGLKTFVSGSPAISYDTEVTASEDISKIDVFAVLMIIILVGLFFRSFVTSAMPPMTIGVAFGVTLCLMFLIGSIIDIVYMTQMLLLVSMLGAGCDYCIFIVARYREERVQGEDHETALKRAVTWAGESITTSGLAVMIGFGAMSICSFSMISSMGIMLAVGIVVALVAALTLITSILAIFGERLFWPTKMESLRKGGKAERGWHGKMSRVTHRYFTASVNASIKHAKLIIVAAILFTLPAAYIMTTSGSSYDMIGSMSTGEAIDGMNEIENYSNGGMIMPDYAVLELAEPLGSITELNSGGITVGMLFWNASNPKVPDYLERLSSVSSSLYDDDNTGEVWGVYPWDMMAAKVAQNIHRAPGTTDEAYMMQVYTAVAAQLPDTLMKQLLATNPNTGMNTLEQILTIYKANFGSISNYNDRDLNAMMNYIVNYNMATSVGGEKTVVNPTVSSIEVTYVKITLVTKDAAMSDRSMETIHFMDRTISNFADKNPDMVSNVWLTGSAMVMYEISELVSSEFLKVELLAVVLIFILLFFVMKSYVTPIRSILTILMSVVWTVAVTHLIFDNLLGEGVMWMIPIILIVVCLGIGMDYDILLTTRIKENHRHKGMSNDEAIRYAVTHSGSVITICGLIMGGAFGTLMLSSTVMLQQFGFALCFAILVDALLVRTYIVPAAMHLLGDLNWKGPKFMHRKQTNPPE